MERKDAIDGFGAAALIGFALLFALNQVSIKVTNSGFRPVFVCALRSAIAIPCIPFRMRLRGSSVRPAPGSWGAGLLIGCVFSAEVVLLYLALDRTTVVRSSVIFYSMPVWLALGAALGWALLDEEISAAILWALALVAVGLLLINRPQAASRASTQTGK
jgi:drug/metabolite transporter (DMT)-like permease